MAGQMTNYAALKLAATTIKDEVEDSANTANRVGGLHPREGAGNGAQQLGYLFGRFINEH